MHHFGKLLLALGLAGCTVNVQAPKTGASSSPAATAASATPEAPAGFSLTSTAFEANGAIPRAFACDGNKQLPPLGWSGVPAKASRTAIVVEDTDANVDGAPFVHLIAWNMPTSDTQLAGSLPFGTVQGNNSAGSLGYTPPCPPGGTHHYRFTLYALDTPLTLKAGATRAELATAMEGHVVGQAELVGTYAKAAT